MFKNWKAICGIEDAFFMWAIALLDLATDFGQMVASRFPEYFTDKEQQGPVPWSVLRMTAEKNAAQTNGGQPCNAANHLECYNAIPESMPILHFAVDEYALDHGATYPPPDLDAALDEADVVGKIYYCGGKAIILVDSIGNCGEWYFVPAECIALDK